MSRQLFPGIPNSTEQTAAYPVAGRGKEKDAEGCGPIYRRATLVLLLQSALIEALADLLRAGREHFLEHAGIEGAWRQGIYIDTAPAGFLRQCFRQPDGCGLTGCVRADSRQRGGGSASRQVYDLSISLPAKMRQG